MIPLSILGCKCQKFWVQWKQNLLKCLTKKGTTVKSLLTTWMIWSDSSLFPVSSCEMIGSRWLLMKVISAGIRSVQAARPGQGRELLVTNNPNWPAARPPTTTTTSHILTINILTDAAVNTGCLPAICKSISEISMIKIAAGKFYLSFSGSEWQAQMYDNGW